MNKMGYKIIRFKDKGEKVLKFTFDRPKIFNDRGEDKIIKSHQIEVFYYYKLRLK